MAIFIWSHWSVGRFQLFVCFFEPWIIFNLAPGDVDVRASEAVWCERARVVDWYYQALTSIIVTLSIGQAHLLLLITVQSFGANHYKQVMALPKCGTNLLLCSHLQCPKPCSDQPPPSSKAQFALYLFCRYMSMLSCIRYLYVYEVCSNGPTYLIIKRTLCKHGSDLTGFS